MTAERLGFEELKRAVIDIGLCHSCGTCAGVCPLGSVSMTYQDQERKFGESIPRLTGTCDDCSLCLSACPGKSVSLPDLDRRVFGRKRSDEEIHLGIFSDCLAGFATEPLQRQQGAGGGASLALLRYALDKDLIDAALVTTLGPDTPWRPKPEIVSRPADLFRSSDYSYSVVPVNSLFAQLDAQGPKRVALVGLPCHIHGFRKMQTLPELQEVTDRVKLVIGVTCHMNFFWESTRHILVEMCGVERLEDIVKLTFNGGGEPKHLVVRLIDGRELGFDKLSHFLWAVTCFVHQRCNVCLDWSAEVADVSLSELWEPWVEPGSPGWSTILIRTEIGGDLVAGARRAGYLYARPSPPEYLVASFGWELKKHSTAYRLKSRSSHRGTPVPDYGLDLSKLLSLRPDRLSPHLVPSRLAGLFGGVVEEEKR